MQPIRAGHFVGSGCKMKLRWGKGNSRDIFRAAADIKMMQRNNALSSVGCI